MVVVPLGSPAVAIAAGQYHSAVLLSDGTVWMWGYNGYGQMGDGTTTNRPAPTAVPLPLASAIALGQSHTIAVAADGVVFGWGANGAGQIGDGTVATSLVPTSISTTPFLWKVATPVFSVAAGTYTSTRNVTISTVTTGATIHYTTTGADPTENDPVATGALLVDRTMTVKAAAWKAGQPASNVASAVYVLQVAAPTLAPGGGTYTAAQLVTMSDSTPGATIRYTTDGTDPSDASAAYMAPIPVATGQTLKAKGFKADWVASTTSTAAYAFIYGTLSPPVASPSAGQYLNDVQVTLSATAGATTRFTTNGADPTTSSAIYTAPVPLSATTTLKAKTFRQDWTTSATLTSVYTLKAAMPTFSLPSGTHPYGSRVTVGTATEAAVLHYTLNGVDPTALDPVIVSGGSLPLANVTLKVSAWRSGYTTSDVTSATYVVDQASTTPGAALGASHTLLLRNDGTIWAWGGNASGQVGDGTKTQRSVPVIVAGVMGVTSLAAGQSHTVALTSDGGVWTWGSNTYGQLGDGTTTQNSLPRQVAGLTGVASIAAGQNFTVALREDGTVWAWGQNANGQLGDGTTTQRTVPTVVPGLSGISAVAAGASHTVAVSSAGAVLSWGLNSNGQLGDGSTTQRASPVQVGGLTGVSRVAAGWYHTLAINLSGNVWAWGQNTYGQLGDGTTTRRLVPTPLQTHGQAIGIAAGQSHSVALTAEGDVWSWGGNNAGQLGNGTLSQLTSPAVVPDLPDTAHVSAGQSHTLAIAADETVWAWGLNATAQIGDGTVLQRASPAALSSAGFEWKVATPVYSVASGTYTAIQNVTLSSVTAGAVVHYTTTGLDPTEADEVAAGPIVVERTLTLKAGAWKDGMPPSNIDALSYTLQAATPTFNPAGGTYTATQAVAMTTSTSGATIRYTMDGSDPTETSPVYAGPVIVATGLTLKARGFKQDWNPSAARTATYSFNYGTVLIPTAAPPGGLYADDQSVVLQATPGATIRYTTNGADPTSSSRDLHGPVDADGDDDAQSQSVSAGSGPPARR